MIFSNFMVMSVLMHLKHFEVSDTLSIVSCVALVFYLVFYFGFIVYFYFVIGKFNSKENDLLIVEKYYALVDNLCLKTKL